MSTNATFKHYGVDGTEVDFAAQTVWDRGRLFERLGLVHPWQHDQRKRAAEQLDALADQRHRTEPTAPAIFATAPNLGFNQPTASGLPLWAPAGPRRRALTAPPRLRDFTKHRDQAGADELLKAYARHLAASTTGTTVTYHERGRASWAAPQITITARDRYEYNDIAAQIDDATAVFFETLREVTGITPDLRTADERRADRRLARYGADHIRQREEAARAREEATRAREEATRASAAAVTAFVSAITPDTAPLADQIRERSALLSNMRLRAALIGITSEDSDRAEAVRRGAAAAYQNAAGQLWRNDVHARAYIRALNDEHIRVAGLNAVYGDRADELEALYGQMYGKLSRAYNSRVADYIVDEARDTAEQLAAAQRIVRAKVHASRARERATT